MLRGLVGPRVNSLKANLFVERGFNFNSVIYHSSSLSPF